MRAIDYELAAFTADPRFTGAVAGVHMAPEEDDLLHAYVVAFEPCCRTAWHSHERGQLLICSEGRGHVGTRDGRVVELRPGSAVWTDAGEDHWHGAASDSPLVHIAVQTETSGSHSVTWHEEVSNSAWIAAVHGASVSDLDDTSDSEWP